MSTQSQESKDVTWLSAFPEDKRFRRIVVLVLTLTLVLSVAIPLIHVPPIDKNKNQPIPQRFAKLILEKKILKQEPKKKELTEAEKEALRKAEEERRKKLEEERKKREAELKKKREAAKKKAEEERKRLEEQRKKERAEALKRAAEQKKLDAERQRQEAERQRKEAERRRAEAERRRIEAERKRIAAEKKKGEELAASLFGDLADLSSEAPAATTATKLVSANKQSTAQQTISSPNLLSSKTSTVGKGTSGIDTSKLSRLDTGGAGSGLETRRATVIEDVDLGVIDPENISESTVNAQGQPTRSARELNTRLEASKGRFNKIYQRALRKDPTIGGKVVLKLTILPSGKVESVEVVSSDIQDKRFLKKLITSVKGINFGAKDNVGKVVATYPIDFGML